MPTLQTYREARKLGRKPPQRALWCPCGGTVTGNGGPCRACSDRRLRDRLHFGGLPEQILRRDGGSCEACGQAGNQSGAGKWSLAVHHRRPGISRSRYLICLCPGCHAKIHRLKILRREVSPVLRLLWLEQHPGAPEQLLFQFDRIAVPGDTLAMPDSGALFD